MKSLLTYHGGKQRLVSAIVDVIPEHISYGEPFAGGAAVFFGKKPSPIEVLNDINGELVNFYQVIKHRMNDLFEHISGTLHSRRQHELAGVIYQYPELFNEIQRAWAVWVLCYQSFGARLNETWAYSLSEGASKRTVLFSPREYFDQYVLRLQNVQLENTDALHIIGSRDSSETFFYCDPPYVNTRLGHYAGYTKEDFRRLLQTLSSIKGKFILSSYPNNDLTEFIDRYGWYEKRIDGLVSLSSKQGNQHRKTELLIANYPLKQRQQQCPLF